MFSAGGELPFHINPSKSRIPGKLSLALGIKFQIYFFFPGSPGNGQSSRDAMGGFLGGSGQGQGGTGLSLWVDSHSGHSMIP